MGAAICALCGTLGLEFFSPSVSLAASAAQGITARINPGGPENWPPEQGLSTQLPGAQAAPDVQPAPPVRELPPLGTQGQMPGTPPAPAAQPATQPAGQPATQPGVQAGAQAAPDVQPAPPVRELPPLGTQGQMPGTPPAPAAQPAGQPATQPAGQAGSQAAPDVQPAPPVRELPSAGTGTESPAGDKASPAAAKREVIYVDEQGNRVEKPVDPEAVWQEVQSCLEKRQFSDALDKLRILYDLPQLTRDRRLEVLYGISDCLWEMYKDKPQAGYDAIVASTSEALNADLRHDRAPEAYARLGKINLRVGNMDEARANIMALLRQYPLSPLVAESLTELGEEQLKRKMDESAAVSFQTVLENYPESASMEDAAMGMGKALVRLGRHDAASVIMDFVNKRWPRCYLEDTDFLLVQAENLQALKRDDAAMDVYWLFVNLQPRREGNNELLLKMADTYTRGNQWGAAALMYQRIMDLWPGVSSSRVSRLRLAEKGIYDGPLHYDQMSALFARPTEDIPLERVYREVMEASDTSPECVLSRLKYAMWLLWDKQFTQAMGSAADFIDNYPEHPGVPQARDIIWTAFQSELTNALAEQNYRRILLLWNGFPLVRERYGELDPKMRYALAQGYMERGDDAKGLELLGAFLTAKMDPDYGELALTEYFNRYLKAGAWDRILDLSRIVAAWPLRPQLRSQLEYATALSAQNLGLWGAALPRWRQLAMRNDIPLYQRAYATYFLARDAEMRKDVGDAYVYNRQVIELFRQLADERSDKADPERIKESMAALMDICEVANRIPEALDWVKQYAEFVPDAASPEYPGLRYREARLYRKLGDAVRAQFLLEDVVKRFPGTPFGKAAASELRTFEVSRDLKDFMPGGAAAGPGASPAQNGADSAGSPPANP